MTESLKAVIAKHALPYPTNSEDPESYILSQDHVPESIVNEADEMFGPAQGGERPVYVIDTDVAIEAGA